MKPTMLYAAAALLLGSVSAFAEETPEQLFQRSCSGCHIIQRPPADQFNTMVAPPISGVMLHIKEAFPSKEAAVRFISDYVFEPDRAKAVCATGAIGRFGLMPSQKGALTPDEANRIAGYLYDTFPMGRRGKGR